ncbi:MAG: hypothetical protein EOM52_12055, partial [Clostridia bacterium]|nr:hypothetical protein [Clostridia bacterium]
MAKRNGRGRGEQRPPGPDGTGPPTAPAEPRPRNPGHRARGRPRPRAPDRGPVRCFGFDWGDHRDPGRDAHAPDACHPQDQHRASHGIPVGARQKNHPPGPERGRGRRARGAAGAGMHPGGHPMTDTLHMEAGGGTAPCLATQSPTIGKLAEALAKAQGMMTTAKKDSDNPFFNSRYADLAACWEVCREPLAKNGLAIIQTTTPTTDGTVRVVSTLAHASGEWIRGELAVKPVKADPQGIGSALTYARRYGLCSLVGIVADEDD